jgi:hypothetical protein
MYKFPVVMHCCLQLQPHFLLLVVGIYFNIPC